VIIPQGHPAFDTWAYIILVAAIITCSQLKGWWRTIALIPTLYWVAVVWENVLAENPAVTALILFGALLVALMQARPQGLLGTARVEIV
jgi:ABC-type branched-subunit amino acid transport system permease subunit